MDEQSMTIGEYLKRSRSQRRLDLEQVSQELHIRVQYLTALESDQWDQLPGEVYATGFLKSYARYLELDADALVKYHKRLATSAPSAGPPSDVNAPPVESKPIPSHRSLSPRAARPHPGRPVPRGATSSPVAVVGAAAVLVILLVVGLIMMRGSKANSSRVATGVVTQSKTPHQGSSPPIRRKRKSPKSPLRPSVTISQVSSSPQQGLATYQVSASPVDVTLSFSGLCWVEVWQNGVSEGASGITYQSGQSVTISSSQSVAVKVGTRSVAISVNGRPMTLPDPNIYPLLLTFEGQ